MSPIMIMIGKHLAKDYRKTTSEFEPQTLPINVQWLTKCDKTMKKMFWVSILYNMVALRAILVIIVFMRIDYLGAEENGEEINLCKDSKENNCFLISEKKLVNI